MGKNQIHAKSQQALQTIIRLLSQRSRVRASALANQKQGRITATRHLKHLHGSRLEEKNRRLER